ncbi:MAG: M14 family zinc carboxypeptidase [Planctomycetota bacterium]
MHRLVPLLLICHALFVANLTVPSFAQEADLDRELPTQFWPDEIDFDDTLTTPKSFLKFEIGQRHLTHAQVVAYLQLLAEQSERISLEIFGQSHGGRPLVMLTITSAKNRERIEEIRAAHLQLADPSTSDDVNVEDLPAVINMGYGVHGDEPSATNVTPLVAHYLAAAKGPEMDRILDQCVILLDPCLNPDGFERFADWANRYRGRLPNPDPNDIEHNQGWPSGRVNYYWFDMNRDWLPAVHPESRSRLKKYHQWKPNVVLDYHEMGTNSTYFFQPGIPERTNPYTPKQNIELTRAFGKYHAKALDQRGSLYYTEERFDDFYMGKGSTYPDLHGGVGILFEQASSRGQVQRNQDGLLTFHETIANQFATSLSSLQATTDMRRELLEYKRSFYQESMNQARQQDTRTLVYTCPNNRSRLQAFAEVLKRHQLDCYWLKSDIAYGDETLTKDSLVVPTDQAEYRFLKSLRMRLQSFEENIFYDVSTWCLPLAFNLDERALRRPLPDEALQAVELDQVFPSKFSSAADDLAYLIDWTDDAAPRLAWKLLDAGVRVRVAMDRLVTADSDRTFAGGTLQVHLGTQDIDAAKIRTILKQGADTGVFVQPVSTSLTPIGFDLGSSEFPVLEKPKVATVVGPGISQYEVGEIWHLLDTEFSIPLTKLPNSRLRRTDLSEYTTLLMPSGSYDLTSSGWDDLRAWVRDGGTIVLTGRGARDRLDQLGGMNAANDAVVNDSDATTSQSEEKLSAPSETSKQQPFNSRSTERALRLISGSIFETRIDRTHPLFFGYPHDTLPVFRNHTANLPLSRSAYLNPGIYTPSPLMAGYASDANVAAISKSASVVVVPNGYGRIIVINDNPSFRGFWKGTQRLLINAIFFGPLVD